MLFGGEEGKVSPKQALTEEVDEDIALKKLKNTKKVRSHVMAWLAMRRPREEESEMGRITRDPEQMTDKITDTKTTTTP